MKPARIHITGASGAGSTTLGHALADRLDFPVHDGDDYYWLPTTPPYRQPRAAEDRARLLAEMVGERADWIFTGSLMGWGDRFIPLLDLVVFLYAPADCRLARLRERETRHFGVDAVAPGGWRHEETEDFIEWSSHYDDGTRDGRNLENQKAWLAALPCPVLELQSTLPRDRMVEAVLARLEAMRDRLADWPVS